MSQLERDTEISSLIIENQLVISGFLRLIFPYEHTPFELIQIICTYSYHILNASIDINCTQIISNGILIIKNTISCDKYDSDRSHKGYHVKNIDEYDSDSSWDVTHVSHVRDDTGIKDGGTIAIFGDIIYNHYNGKILASEKGYNHGPGQAPVCGPDYNISCGSSYGTIGGRMLAMLDYGETTNVCCHVDLDENGKPNTPDDFRDRCMQEKYPNCNFNIVLLKPGAQYGAKTLNTLFHGSGTHYLRRYDSTHRGGGTIIIYCNVFINDGLLESNGDKGCTGGSILIVCNKFYNFGNINANGGRFCVMGKRGEVPYGGDGRIAIYCDFYKNNGKIQPDPYQNSKDLNKYYMIKESIKCSKYLYYEFENNESKDICIQNKNVERICVYCEQTTNYKCWCSRCNAYFCADGYCGFGKKCVNCIRDENKTIVINTTIPYILQ